MSKARDLANAGTALGAVSPTELGYVDGVTSAIQTQIDGKEATLPDQTGNSGKYLTTNGTAKSWGTVSQYALPSQTGNAGKFLTTNGTAESWGTLTVPPVWTMRKGITVTGYTALVNSIAYNGTNLYVAVCNNGFLYTSPDAITWTSRTSGVPTSDDIYTIAYGNGIWVFGGSGGRISTSTDGVTWTARTSNMSTNSIYAVRYLNGNWIAVGSGAGTGGTGGITTSTDGTTWTRRATTSGGSICTSVDYGNGYYVVGSDANNNNYYYSSDSSTWSAQNTGLSMYGTGVQYVKYANGYWMLFHSGTSGAYATTASPPLTGSTWISPVGKISEDDQNIAKEIQFANNSFYSIKTIVSGSNFSMLNSLSATITNNRITSFGQPIICPSAGIVASRALYVTSTGGFIVGDSEGRIYTSF